MRCCIVILAVLIASDLNQVSEAGNYFRDDFEDGSATDGTPANWVPVPGWGTGTREVVDGSFVHTPAGSDPILHEMDTDVAGETYGDVSLRSQFSISGSCWAVLYARSTYDIPGVVTNFQVFGYVRGFGRNTFQIALGYANDLGANLLAETFVPLPDREADLHLQFDVFGDSMRLTGWPDGSDRPAAPQLTYDISALTDRAGTKVSEGKIGVFVVPFGPNTQVAFRDFEVVPEPSTWILFVGGVASLLTHAWHRR